MERQLFKDLESGWYVEPGVHFARIKEKLKGGKRVQKLKVR